MKENIIMTLFFSKSMKRKSSESSFFHRVQRDSLPSPSNHAVISAKVFLFSSNVFFLLAINFLPDNCARILTRTSRPQPRQASVLQGTARSKPAQSSPARPAKRVGRDAEQQRIQSTVDVPQWK